MNWKLSVAAGLLSVLLVSLLVGVPVRAQGPTLPWTVWGQVTINNAPADPGTPIEARNPFTGMECGQSSVSTGGNYALDVEGNGQTAGCFSNGDSVQLRVQVNGAFLEAQQAPAGRTFQSGNVQSVNLSVTAIASCRDVASRWRLQSGDPGWSTLFDLDGDKRITIKDVMISVSSGKCP